MPIFSTQEEKDRAFWVKVGDGFQEVKLKGRIVKWLCDLNENKRNEQSIDKHFVKALLIAIFSVKTIKENGALDVDLMAFINGISIF